MSVQNRKKRQLAEREQLFLARAWALIEREGVLNLQMAQLAKECEYAVGTIYLHFSSKEDLLVALAAQKMGERAELFQRAANWSAPPRHRLLAILVADLSFTLQAPEFYRLTEHVSTQSVWQAASEQRQQDVRDASLFLEEIVETVVVAAMEQGDLPAFGLCSRDLVCGVWALCKGMSTMVGVGRMMQACKVQDPCQLLFMQTDALLNGWSWQPMMDLNDTAAREVLLRRILTDLFPEFSHMDGVLTAQPHSSTGA